MSLDEYKMLSCLGNGTFSHVYLAINKATNETVAIKRIKKDQITPATFKFVKREIEIMKKIKHPFVVHLYNVIENETTINIVMEYIKGRTLGEIIREDGHIEEEKAIQYFVELISILNYLHEDLSIVHRDLKLENIIVDNEDHVHLIDFGLSNILIKKENNTSNLNPIEEDCNSNLLNKPPVFNKIDEDKDNNNNERILLTTACGTVAYAAPELVVRSKYDEKIDIWSSGVVLYAMLCGHLPFDRENIQKTYQMIMFENPDYPPYLSDDVVDLLTNLLKKEKNERISAKGIINLSYLHDKFVLYHQQHLSVPPLKQKSIIFDGGPVTRSNFQIVYQKTDTLNSLKRKIRIHKSNNMSYPMRYIIRPNIVKND